MNRILKNIFRWDFILEMAKAAYADESSLSTSQRVLSSAAKTAKSFVASSHDSSSLELGSSAGHWFLIY